MDDGLNCEDLIRENMPLIKHVAAKFYQVPFEDLVQAGSMGVLKALKKFRQDGTCKFSTYAYDYIFGEMYDLVMKERKIKVNKDILRLAKQIDIAKNTLALKMGRSPNYEEIATFLGLSTMQIAEVASLTAEMISLDNNTEEARELYETIPLTEKISLEDKVALQSSLEALSADEQKILEYRYFEDLTQKETAVKMGMTQVMISRKEKKGLERLRSFYEVV